MRNRPLDELVKIRRGGGEEHSGHTRGGRGWVTESRGAPSAGVPLGAFGRCHTPFPAARELSSDLRSFSHTPDASR